MAPIARHRHRSQRLNLLPVHAISEISRYSVILCRIMWISRSGGTPAAHQGDFAIVQELLKYKADVNVQCAAGETPLHLLSRSNSRHPNLSLLLAKVARLLLQHGANVNALENDRFTALHIAAQHGKVEVVRVLLEYGADVTAVGNHHLTALHLAARHGKVEVVRVLLDHGADVGAESDDGRTAFQLAEEEEGPEIKKLLSEYGAR